MELLCNTPKFILLFCELLLRSSPALNKSYSQVRHKTSPTVFILKNLIHITAYSFCVVYLWSLIMLSWLYFCIYLHSPVFHHDNDIFHLKEIKIKKKNCVLYFQTLYFRSVVSFRTFHSLKKKKAKSSAKKYGFIINTL